MARVLIVEDDPLVRSAMVADLTQRAHAVRTAGTALDGIREAFAELDTVARKATNSLNAPGPG